MLAKLLRVAFWRAFFRIGVAQPGDPIEPDDGVEVTPDEPEVEEEVETEVEAETETEVEAEVEVEAPRSRRPASEVIREEKARRKEVEERLRRNEEELIALRRSNPPATVVTPEQRSFQEEEAKLRDPNTSDLEKWQINANRELRANRQTSQELLRQAQDTNDRTNFEKIAQRAPGVFKKYAPEVESELQKLRQQGGNATREQVLALLIGRDQIRGDLKPAKKTAAKPAGQDVPRGRTPGVRSDVSGRESKSESDKRRARLEKMYI